MEPKRPYTETDPETAAETAETVTETAETAAEAAAPKKPREPFFRRYHAGGMGRLPRRNVRVTRTDAAAKYTK